MKLPFHMVFEGPEDAHYPNGLMAIGLVPMPLAARDRIREVLGKLPLAS